MPTTLRPPEIDRRRHGPREDDHGSGRRPPPPPNLKRTGGNGEGDGDGDNFGSHPRHPRGPRDRLATARMGVLLALCAVVAIFIGLVVAFLLTKSSGQIDVHRNLYVQPWRPTPIPSILYVNTFVLLLSSLTAEFARRSMFREHELMEEWLGLGRPISRRASRWLALTLAFGLTFLAGQCIAWKQLLDHRPFAHASQSKNFFYLLTASHAFHLILGVAALTLTLVVLRGPRAIGTRQVWVDATVWYWHAMGALWLLLFLLLRFGQ